MDRYDRSFDVLLELLNVIRTHHGIFGKKNIHICNKKLEQHTIIRRFYLDGFRVKTLPSFVAAVKQTQNSECRAKQCKENKKLDLLS